MTNGTTPPPVVPADENQAMQDLINAQARVIVNQNALILYYQDLVNAMQGITVTPSAHVTGTTQVSSKGAQGTQTAAKH